MDIDSFTKKITNTLGDGPFNELFTNPIYVSIIITIIVVLIVVCMFNQNKLIKTSFYILCTNLVIIFIHNKLLLIDHRKKICKNDTDSVVNSIDNSSIITGGDVSGGLNYLQM